MADFLSLDDVDLEGRTILLRVDINSPMQPTGNVFLDDTRIRRIGAQQNGTQVGSAQDQKAN